MTKDKEELEQLRSKFKQTELKVKEAPKEHPYFGRICHCLCHIDEVNVFCSCWIQCCVHEQKKYFDEDGSFDINRFGELIMNQRLQQKGKLKK